MYIRIYIYMYTYVYIHTYIYIYIYVYIYMDSQDWRDKHASKMSAPRYVCITKGPRVSLHTHTHSLLLCTTHAQSGVRRGQWR